MLNSIVLKNSIAIIFCLLSYCASGQSDYRIITETVTDRYGNPLSGVSVRERDRMYNLGSISDGNGNFRITMYHGYSGLIFSHIDYMMVDIDKPYDGMKVVMKEKFIDPFGYHGHSYKLSELTPEYGYYGGLGLSKVISDTPMKSFLSYHFSMDLKSQINEIIYVKLGLGHILLYSNYDDDSFVLSSLVFPLTVGLKVPRKVYPVAEIGLAPAINLGTLLGNKMKFVSAPLIYEGKLGIGIKIKNYSYLQFLMGYAVTGEMVSKEPVTYEGTDYLRGYFQSVYLMIGCSVPF